MIYCHATTDGEALLSGAYCCDRHDDGTLVVGCAAHDACFTCNKETASDSETLPWTRYRSYETVMMDISDPDRLNTVNESWRERLEIARRKALDDFAGTGRQLPSLSDVARGRAERLWANDFELWNITARTVDNLATFIEQEIYCRPEPWVLAIDNVTRELSNKMSSPAFISAMIYFSKRFQFNLALEWCNSEQSATIMIDDKNTIKLL